MDNAKDFASRNRGVLRIVILTMLREQRTAGPEESGPALRKSGRISGVDRVHYFVDADLVEGFFA